MSGAEIETATTGLFTSEVIAEFISSFLPDVEVLQAGEHKLDNRPAGFALASTTYQTAGVRVDHHANIRGYLYTAWHVRNHLRIRQ
jgi:hypothetical protein